MNQFKVLSALMLFGAGLIGFQACTDLDPKERDSVIVSGTGGGTPASATDLLASAYKDLSAYAAQDHIYALTEHATDEMMGPTRGTDWGDNGIWRTLHAHTWDASHGFVISSWNQLNSRVYKCTQILASNPSPAEEAQAKFLRAFNMWHIMDLYGQVPFRNTTDGVDVNPRVYTRSEAFDLVEKDLTEAISSGNLPVIGPTADNYTASRAAANALLARLYLNKATYKGTSFDNADMDKVIAACDAVTGDGFTPEADYFANFQSGAAKEIILTSQEGSGQNRVHMTLHYDNKPSGWNGFVVLSDFYNKFDASDPRRGRDGAKDGSVASGLGYGFLIGQQYNDSGVEIKNSRAGGTPLAFTTDCRLSGASTEKGIRCLKYHPYGPDYDHLSYPKYILLRYGDVVTMKAEALLRKGDVAGATTVVDNLRLARGGADCPFRARRDARKAARPRMYWEGRRRRRPCFAMAPLRQIRRHVAGEDGHRCFPRSLPDTAAGPRLKSEPAAEPRLQLIFKYQSHPCRPLPIAGGGLFCFWNPPSRNRQPQISNQITFASALRETGNLPKTARNRSLPTKFAA